MWRLFILSLSLSLTVACATPRKLSQVGLREPAGAQETTVISPLRQRAIITRSFAPACPAAVRAEFPLLVAERLTYPACPDRLADSYQNAMIYLKLEERSTVEEVLGSQCRSLGLGEYGESLEQLTSTFDTTGPLGRRAAVQQTLQSTVPETKSLTELKSSLEELVNRNLPIERWGRRYGDFVVPEEDLASLGRLVLDRGCRLGEEEVDEAYRTIRGLEDLSKILPNGDQRARIERFLSGVHQIIDQRIQEYFQP